MFFTHLRLFLHNKNGIIRKLHPRVIINMVIGLPLSVGIGAGVIGKAKAIQRDPAELAVEEIRQYLLYGLRERKMGVSTQNQIINAVKFYYEQVLGRDCQFHDMEPPDLLKRYPKY